MREIPVIDAVGTVLAHDLTQILPGTFKGSKFKKGHIIKMEDIQLLLSMGKKHLFILEKGDHDVHEDEAALRIGKTIMGAGLTYEAKGEGKIEIYSAINGLLKINKTVLEQIVDDDQIVLATIHENQMVRKGEKIAATRVIPLFVKEEVISRVEHLTKDVDVVSVIPLQSLKVGIVTTGSEIFSGMIKDEFGPVLIKKFRKLGSEVLKQIFSDDDEIMIAASIKEIISEGAELICVTGGMSVDPDDRTPLGIRKAGAEVITYGASVLPGAMFMLAYIGEIPVVGLPGCVMYSRTSIFDLIVPRILAGEKPSKAEIKKLAYGGLCLDCKNCQYPMCGFGKA